jgi:hypothetical protein
MLGGAVLGLADFDLPYYLIISAILLEYIAQKEVAAERRAERAKEAELAQAPSGALPVPGT